MDKKARNVILNWKNKKNIPIYILLIYFLFVVFTYSIQFTLQEFKKDSIILIVILWLLVSLIGMLEIAQVRSFFKKYSRWINAFLFLLSPITSFVMVEVMVSNYNLKMFRSYSLANLVWYCAIYFLFYVVARDSKLTIIISDCLVYFISLVNYFVYIFRGNPILPSDILAWKTGMSVATNYKPSFTKGFVIATLMMFILFVLANKLEKTDRSLSIRNRVGGIGIYLVFISAVFTLFFHTDYIKAQIKVLDFFAPKYTYCSYGTVFGFVANVEALKTDPPEGYSVKKVEMALHPIEENTKATKTKPNIIVIMNEAFSDLSLIGDFETNMDYLPYLRSLTDNTIKGNLYVSVFGGATSDTEYEFLTGNSMATMPKNCVPYQQFVTKPTDSLATTLKAQGYYNIAIHPYNKSGYKRDIVYPLLGFDEFLSMEDFSNPELIRSYISDSESYKKIIEQYETKGSDNSLFIFNVTMQNHGGYGGQELFGDEGNVKLTGMPGYQNAEQYLSLLRKTDQSFQILTDYFSKQEEPTIILIFGDHQPALFSSFHDILENSGEVSFSDSYQKKYVVPFFLWANYDITETKVDKISANYLSSYLLSVAGLEGTEYNQYLMELYQKLPVINGLFYIDKNNQFYGLEEPSAYYDLINEYLYVGYNNALDKDNRLTQAFRLE